MISILVQALFCGDLILFLCDVYLEVEVLSYWIEAASSFQGSCNILHTHQQCMGVIVALLSCQHLVLSVFFRFSYSGEGVGMCHCGFSCAFPDDSQR